MRSPISPYFPSAEQISLQFVCLATCWLLRAGWGYGDSTEQLYTLQIHGLSNRIAEVRVEFAAEGHLKTPGEKAAEDVEMHVSAKLTFQDRPLGDAFMGSQDLSVCAHRHYQEIDVHMTVGKREMSPEFRDSRKRIGVYRQQNGRLEYFCPDGPLTRDELDLIRLPGDRQTLPLLLPKTPVRIGTVWQLKPATMAAILALDVVGDSDVKSTLISVERGFARVEFEGVVHGAVAGVATEFTIKGRYYFYMQGGEFASIQLVTHERRDIGHINPGVDITARLKMRLEPRTDAGHLSDFIIDDLGHRVAHGVPKLRYASAQLGLEFDYDADWYATAEDRQAVVFRQLWRGDLIAQCNISKLPSIKKGKALTLTQFEKDIRDNLEENFSSFVRANETTSASGHLIYRVEALGTASAIPVRWIYYLLSDTNGRQAALVFTMEQEQEKQFDDADLDWIRSVRFVPGSENPQAETEVQAEDVDE